MHLTTIVLVSNIAKKYKWKSNADTHIDTAYEKYRRYYWYQYQYCDINNPDYHLPKCTFIWSCIFFKQKWQNLLALCHVGSWLGHPMPRLGDLYHTRSHPWRIDRKKWRSERGSIGGRWAEIIIIYKWHYGTWQPCTKWYWYQYQRYVKIFSMYRPISTGWTSEMSRCGCFHSDASTSFLHIRGQNVQLQMHMKTHLAKVVICMYTKMPIITCLVHWNCTFFLHFTSNLFTDVEAT